MFQTLSRERAGGRVLPPGVKSAELSTGDSLATFQSGGHFIYLLESGIAIVERDNRQGGWDNLGYRRPDSVFGERLQDAREQSYYKKITALRPSTLLRIERAQLGQVLEDDPNIAGRLRNAIEADAYATEDRLAFIGRSTLAERMPIVLLDLTNQSTDVRIDATQEWIAKAIGGERATVNQMLMRLKRMGIILEGKGIAINGQGGLQALQSMAEGISPVVSSNSRVSSNGTNHSMIPN